MLLLNHDGNSLHPILEHFRKLCKPEEGPASQKGKKVFSKSQTKETQPEESLKNQAVFIERIEGSWKLWLKVPALHSLHLKFKVTWRERSQGFSQGRRPPHHHCFTVLHPVPSCHQTSSPHRRHLCGPDSGDRENVPGYSRALHEATTLQISREGHTELPASFW